MIQDDSHPAGAIDRQGGDTFATARPITHLPYSTSGTTIGYNHDYDEICPYNQPGAPDVVYRLVACFTGMLSVTLCAGVVDGWSPGDEGIYTMDLTGLYCDESPTDESTFSSAKALFR